MRWLFGFLGGVLLFLGASCAVAEVLLLTLGDAEGLYSLQDLWAALGGPGLAGPAVEGDDWRALLWQPMAWLLALPSWLVFLSLGGLFMLGGGRGRERTFG